MSHKLHCISPLHPSSSRPPCLCSAPWGSCTHSYSWCPCPPGGSDNALIAGDCLLETDLSVWMLYLIAKKKKKGGGRDRGNISVLLLFCANEIVWSRSFSFSHSVI